MSMPVSRLTSFLAGLVCGGYAAVAAFRNGYSLGSTEVDGYIIGAAFAAVVVGSWPLLGLAERRKAQGLIMHAWGLRFGWALLLAFILVNAVGYAATHRAEKTGDKVIAAEAYERAQIQFDALTQAIADMKGNDRWTATAGCTDATVDKSIEFCDRLQAKEALLADTNLVLSKGRPAAADPQAETVAWVLDGDPKKTAKAMPIFLGVILEIAASIFFFAAAEPSRREEKVAVVKAEVEPVKTTPVQRATPVARLKAEPAIPALTFKADGRKWRHVKAKVANDATSTS